MTKSKNQAADRPVVGYVRVSTADQADNGISVDAQQECIHGWAKSKGLAVVKIYIDAGISGGRADNRPELQAALRHAEKDRAALVFYSLSRLARSTRDTIEIAEGLEQAGADMVSLSESIDTTTAAGKMVFRMLAVLAEFERDVTAERTTTALAYKRSKGEYTGGEPPFGYHATDRNGVMVLEVDSNEQTIMSSVREWRRDGCTYAQIIVNLECFGMKNRSGGRWNLASIHNILSGEEGLTKRRPREIKRRPAI